MAGRRKHKWTQREVDRVVELFGSHDVETIARKLGRTPRGVMHVVHREGLGFEAVMHANGYITTGKLARICRVSYQAVHMWIKRGMPATCKYGNWRWVKLSDAREWMATRPQLLATMHPAAKRLLRLTPDHLEELEAA